MDLNQLILDFSSKQEPEIIALTKSWYASLYLNKGHFGVHALHDGETAIFLEHVFEHAFYTSKKGPPYDGSKDKFDVFRAQRVKWIKELMSGNVEKFQCWEVPARSGRPLPPNRFYAIFKPYYILWFEPRRDGSGFSFSSAYPTRPDYIRQQMGGGTRLI